MHEQPAESPRIPSRAPPPGQAAARAAEERAEVAGADAQTLDERTKLLAVAGTMLSLFLAALDQTIVATALPRITAELQGLSLYAWVTTAYLLASTAMVPVFGRLSDQHGRRTVLLAGIGLFVGASALCGAAWSMESLVAFRAAQGLGAAALTSTAFTVIADLYEPRQRARMQGLFSAVFGTAAVVGPVLGGVLSDQLSWRWVFYVNVPLGALAALFVARRMPALRPGVAARIDYPGAALLVCGTAAVLLALSGRTAPGPGTFALGIAGLAVLGAFVAVERRAAAPLMPLALFRNRTFAAVMTISFVFGTAFFAAILFLPLYMVRVLGVSATAAGASLLPFTAGVVVASVASGQVVSRLGGSFKPHVLAGLVVSALGFVLLAMLAPGATAGDVAWRMVVIGLGFGPVMPLLNLAVQGAVERAHLGLATASRQFFQQLGGVFGAALLGAVLNAGVAAGQRAGLAEPILFAHALRQVFVWGLGAVVLALLVALLLPRRADTHDAHPPA